MKNLREEILKINQVAQQVQVLEELTRRKMSSSEIESFAEGLGLDWVLLLPTLKKSNLLKIEKIQSSRQFWYWIPHNGNGHKEEKPLKIVLPSDKSISILKNEITRRKKGKTDP